MSGERSFLCNVGGVSMIVRASTSAVAREMAVDHFVELRHPWPTDPGDRLAVQANRGTLARHLHREIRCRRASRAEVDRFMACVLQESGNRAGRLSRSRVAG